MLDFWWDGGTQCGQKSMGIWVCVFMLPLISLMSGSCHLDRGSNVQIGVECQIFVIVIFFNCGWVLPFGEHSSYYKDALTQKRSFVVICTTFRSDFHVC